MSCSYIFGKKGLWQFAGAFEGAEWTGPGDAKGVPITIRSQLGLTKGVNLDNIEYIWEPVVACFLGDSIDEV